jgi:cell division protein FtsL
MSQAISGARPGVRVTSWIRWEAFTFAPTVALGLLIMGGALLYVWQHTQVVRLGYAIEGLRERQAALVQEHKALRLEMGQLRSLRRVEEIARKRLGMVTAKPGQIVLLPESPVQ